MSKKGPKLETLSVGVPLGAWKVQKKLGSGAFGAVYLVSNPKHKGQFAMKIEAIDLDDDSMLRMEVAVLKMFQSSKFPHPHICDYMDSGMTRTLRYVVMTLAGPNLGEVWKWANHHLSESTVIRLGIQCVQSIESLHQIGFVHRDIKPPNYAIGVGPTVRIIYLLDFGLSRQFVDRHGRFRTPRNKVGFRGTVRYASLNAHLKRDLGRHDDLWSLLYMLIELQRGKLPWKSIYNRNVVCEMKKNIVADTLLKGMAPEFHPFLNELHGLQFNDTPSYKYFCDQLEAAMKRLKIRYGDPFDWETSRRFTKTKKCSCFRNPFRRKKEQKKSRKEHSGEERSRLSL